MEDSDCRAALCRLNPRVEAKLSFRTAGQMYSGDLTVLILVHGS